MILGGSGGKLGKLCHICRHACSPGDAVARFLLQLQSLAAECRYLYHIPVRGSAGGEEKSTKDIEKREEKTNDW